MKKTYFLILIVLVFFSCKKNTDSASTAQVDVYVAGWEFNGTSIVAKYWKNGQSVNREWTWSKVKFLKDQIKYFFQSSINNYSCLCYAKTGVHLLVHAKYYTMRFNNQTDFIVWSRKK